MLSRLDFDVICEHAVDLTRIQLSHLGHGTEVFPFFEIFFDKLLALYEKHHDPEKDIIFKAKD